MIVKELAIVTRVYTDRDGKEKKVWKNIGAIHEHEGRQYITLDSLINLAAVPRKDGDDRVFVSMFEPKPKQAAQALEKPVSKIVDNYGTVDEELPF
jgi:hypothetical protein